MIIRSQLHKIVLMYICGVLLIFSGGILGADETGSQSKSIPVIASVDELKSLLETKQQKLLMFDLYADWCLPCRMLSPMLAEIALEMEGNVEIYKVNVDKTPDIAGAFGVSGIPYVALVKKKEVVYAFTGLQPKDKYIRKIRELSSSTSEFLPDSPDGILKDGVRNIRLSTSMSPDKIYVFRGETVKLTIEHVDFPYSVHIPALGISQEGTVGKDLDIIFNAEKVGVFPIFCNGQCPTGDGARYGQIVVMPLASTGESRFHEVTVDQAVELIKTKNALILDVRMPYEYYRGHLKNAKLLPLPQLEYRLSEIEDYKDKDILIYCRSGNRSTVAAEILIHHGFKKLHHLRFGIRDWIKQGRPVQEK